MRQRKHQWALPLLKSMEQVVINFEQPYTHIVTKKGTALEIGTGKGDFILAMSLLFPEIDFIGVESQTSVLGIAAQKLELNPGKNIRLVLMNAEHIDEVLDEQSLDTIYLNFSDPWPKTRHEKRRLTSPKFLAKYDKLLIPNGLIVLKTDNKDLFDYSLETIQTYGYQLELVNENYADFDFANDAMSEYEKKFRSMGQTIYRLIARKGE